MRSGFRVEAPWAAVGVLLALTLFGSSCVEGKTYKPPPPPDPTIPTVPQPRLPQNDAYEGSTVLGRLQPRFVWEPSTVEVGELTRYELQYAADKKFAQGVKSVQVVEPSFRPSEPLEISTVPPVGRRYYWRVRACAGELCSEFSRPWWVNLGRSMKDFNGDGYDDVVVGAFAPSASQHEIGNVYVYFGGSGATFDPSPDAITYDLEKGSWIGFSVSSAGDFNGDGFADVLIGAPRRDLGVADAGVAYLLFGGPGAVLNNVVDVYFYGEGASEELGYSVSSAGDVNADGYSDVIVGAPGRTGRDRAFVYWGMPNPSMGASRTALLVPTGASFGAGVSNAGDLNGDGYADVIVSAANFLEDGFETCSSPIFLGGESFDGVGDGQITGAAGEKCSLRATDAGDVNADGFSDLVARIRLRSEGLRLFLGGTKLPTAPDMAFTLASGHRCLEASSIGDVNGDGADDLAMMDTANSTDTKISLYLGKSGARERAISDVPAVTIARPSPLFGRAISAAGDLNGDGYDDFVSGDTSGSDNNDIGNALVFFGNGGGSVDASPDGTLTNGDVRGYFGISVAAADDRTLTRFARSSARGTQNLGLKVVQHFQLKQFRAARRAKAR